MPFHISETPEQNLGHIMLKKFSRSFQDSGFWQRGTALWDDTSLHASLAFHSSDFENDQKTIVMTRKNDSEAELH